MTETKRTIKATHLGYGFYHIKASEAKSLCSEQKLPKHGYEKPALLEGVTLEVDGKKIDCSPETHQGWIKRTPLNGTTVWAIALYDKIPRNTEKIQEYPPIPDHATLYQHNYGYEKPTELGEWGWSTTFGRWGRSVTFADGWSGFTWPKL